MNYKLQNKIIQIFPTPVYMGSIPKEISSEVSPFLDKEPMEEYKIEKNQNQFGRKSLDTYVLNNKKYNNLNKVILEHVKVYNDTYLNYNYVNYKFTQSWISIKHPNEQHIPHTHAHSLVSGVFFYEEYSKDTPNLFFQRSDKYSKELAIHKNKIMWEQDTPNHQQSTYLNFQIQLQPNLLVLFPSYMQHGVGVNLTNIPRKSLAFNIVPQDGFGFEEGLVELKFNN